MQVYQESIALCLFANVAVAKASHMAKPTVNVGYIKASDRAVVHWRNQSNSLLLGDCRSVEYHNKRYLISEEDFQCETIMKWELNAIF